ncbi:leucine-rich repeat-containing protein 15-like [Mercenaria mercenaria]|uniref:leucine-rich repeat-containing protein 15-like n=1 Tax=Mercenaria mercenaria TaxID=6596 RepID=UPI00234F0994|nr:leucine-rich repeat-containing protein 15-like [Mercenaria mercenaria]
MEMLQKLLLIVAIVTQMSTWLVYTCPTNCNCAQYRTVTCSQVSSLKNIGPDIPKDTNKFEVREGQFYNLQESDFADMPASSFLQLKLTNGQLTDIQQYTFKAMTRLQILDLSNNALQQISSPDLFKPLSYLQLVDLSGNRLNDLPSGLFASQSNLQELRIAGNTNIRNLRGPSFQGVTSLVKLLASGCSISTLENDLFSAISSIRTLDLSYNQIKSLPNTDSFRLLQKLQNLTLQGNQISALNDGQFAGMDLDTLDLSKNLIATISPNAFMYLSGVGNLDLSGNRIHSLPAYVFQPISSKVYNLKLNNNHVLINLPPEIFNGMHKMNTLNLSSCAIKLLSEEHFQQVPSLRQIDLSNNWLKYLPQSFFDKAMYMQHVKLANNPWNCDCLIKPLHNWLQNPQSSNIIYCTEVPEMGFRGNCQSPKCSSPQNLVNRDISRLLPNDIEDCIKTGTSSSAPVGIIVGVLAGLVVVVIIILIVACYLYRRHKRGDPLICYEPAKDEEVEKKKKKKHRELKAVQGVRKLSREPKGGRGDRDYYREKKENRKIDAESSSLNESDKSFVVRNFFHSMMPDPDGHSEGTHSQSMARKDSIDSLSQSGYGYNSRPGSRHSSQYSLNAGYKIESAV